MANRPLRVVVESPHSEWHGHYGRVHATRDEWVTVELLSGDFVEFRADEVTRAPYLKVQDADLDVLRGLFAAHPRGSSHVLAQRARELTGLPLDGWLIKDLRYRLSAGPRRAPECAAPTTAHGPWGPATRRGGWTPWGGYTGRMAA